MNKEEILKKIFFSPSNPYSFSSVSKLHHAAKKIDNDISRKDVLSFLHNTRTYTSHKKITYKFLRRKTIVKGINDQWQIDLISIFNLKEKNEGILYLLACIDCFSRYAYVQPLKNKTAYNTLQAFLKILSESKTKPHIIQLDQGSEFKGIFRKFLTDHKIKYFSTSQDTKCAIVERFNRTIQDKIYKYLTFKNTLRYIDILQDLVYAYNHSKHRTLGISPAEVNKHNEKEIWLKQYGKYLYSKKNKLPFQVGDKVRISKYKTAFRRGYSSPWKKEIFQVAYILRTKPATYVLIDQNNEILSGSFYEEELNKIEGK